MNNAQAKMDALKQWAPEKLRARVPKWAKQVGFPGAPFKADLSQVLPRGPMTVISNESHRAWVFEYRFKDRGINAAEYVSRFDAANGFKPVAVNWITPTLGNWA